MSIMNTGPAVNVKEQALNGLAAALDRESYEWLYRNQAEIARALERAIDAGATIGEINRLAWNLTQRAEIVTRMQSAARHLLAGRE